MSLSRREFARLSALSVLGSAVDKTYAGQVGSETKEPERKIGYAIIGLGGIANHFMRAVQASKYCRITGLVSGHRDKAERIAHEQGVPVSSIYNYENMDEIVHIKEIDAVYVALPNSMHAEYTIRSAKAGKHVLCEKPMCTTVEDAKQMVAACKAANVKLMVAYRCQYEPLHLKVKKMLADGMLGKVQTISSCYGGTSRVGEWRLDPKMAGGGPLFDIGIYSLNASRFLTGEEPVHFSAVVSTPDKTDVRFAKVEENVSWLATFPSGIVASGMCTYGAFMPGSFRIYGSKGWLEMNPGYSYDGLHLTASYNATGIRSDPFTNIDELESDHDPIEFTHEADHMAECIMDNQTPRSPGEEGLRDMEYLMQIYRAAGVAI